MQYCKAFRFSAGSSLVEFVVLLAVLLPIGFGVVMLGKLTDLKQTVEQASRYSAWEATVYSRQTLMAQEASTLESRFFSSPNTPVISQSSHTVAREQENTSLENPLWGSSAIRRGSLRDQGTVARLKNSAVQQDYTFDTGKASAALLTGKAIAKAGRPLARFKGNSWEMAADGLLRSTINVPLQTTEFLPSSTTGCGQPSQFTASAAANSEQTTSACVSAAGVILADGWGAPGDAQVVSQVRSLVPGSTLSSVGKGVGKLLGSVLFPELESLDEAFGHVDMSVLPQYAKP